MDAEEKRMIQADGELEEIDVKIESLSDFIEEMCRDASKEEEKGNVIEAHGLRKQARDEEKEIKRLMKEKDKLEKELGLT